MSALVRAWDPAWFGPVLNLRAWLMVRAMLLMLALDAWLLMIERGGRYGAGDFNVSHFAWLDAIQPVPTAGFYVGLILTCGVLGMLIVLGALGRGATIVLTATYTYGWSMSQLDSYQHHVFISWVLLCLCCLPRLETRTVIEAPQMICAWGFRLLAAVTAVLYLFTGISKAEPEWLSGSVLKRINSTGGDLEPFRELFAMLGAEDATFWTFSGHSVVAVQWAITATWLSVLVWGEASSRWARLGRFLGVCSACAFHIGAEIFGLKIGWFSWYMLAMTVIAFTPAPWLETASRPLRALMTSLREETDRAIGRREERVWALLSVLAAAALAIVGDSLDLPGTREAGLLWAALIVVPAARHLLRAETMRTWALAATLIAVSLSSTVDLGRARYDFYRFVGGDATRRLEFDHALQAYGRANTYAPEGEGRWKKADKVKRMLHRANRARK